MTVHDLHPEELLDRAAQGLSPQELADLQRHLARCLVCAAQVRLRADLALDLTPTASDRALAARLVARTRSGARAPSPPARLRGRRRAGLGLRATIVAGVLLAGGAAAALWAPAAGLVRRGLGRGPDGAAAGRLEAAEPGRPRRVPARAAAPIAAAPAGAPPRARAPIAAAPVGAPVRAAAPIAAAPIAPPGPRLAAPAGEGVVGAARPGAGHEAEPAADPGPGRARRPGARSSGATRRLAQVHDAPAAAAGEAPDARAGTPDRAGQPPGASAAPGARRGGAGAASAPAPRAPDGLSPSVPPAVAPLAARPALLPTRAARPLPPQARAAEESAAALFGAATEARRRGDGQAAVLHFARLSRAFPGSREELTGRVLAARLLLDRLGRPADAEALYARYLADAADGPLAEEARVGRALACGALGRQEDERRAWQELLARHPASVHRARALAALQRLERGR